jgi:hypothetical protein
VDNRNLDKALDIVSKLIIGENIHHSQGNNIALYEEYTSSGEVYELVQVITKKMNLSLYEYNSGLYLTAGENNKVFGFNNEELKKILGIKRNRELYLCYFIIYNIITRFYNDSDTYTYVEYVRIEDIIHSVDSSLSNIIMNLEVYILNEVEENSFKAISLIWEDMPILSGEDNIQTRAARNSKAGLVKVVFNFLLSQDLFIEAEERYYPKERLKALTENYFREHGSRLHEILSGKGEL